MTGSAHEHLIGQIREVAKPLSLEKPDFSRLMELVGDAHYVLIGEATHGTEEFYRLRAAFTRELIAKKGFSAVAVEADWPDSYRANRYVRGDEHIHNAQSALAEFARFPTWMWRNEAVIDFLDWLRDYNDTKTAPLEKVGFYGLDLYSLDRSIAAVISYLDKKDPLAARRARQYYGCFDHYYAEQPQQYGYASAFGLTENCANEVVYQLVAMQQQRLNYMRSNGFAAEEEFFCAEQNAKVVISAEEYYRSMFSSRVSSWNLRDSHMLETLEALAEHITTQQSTPAKIVVWAHNSHLGDARATEMGQRGEWNLGQLVRERHGRDCVNIGFSTYEGTVTAASEWDGDAETKRVLPALKESYEALFHETGLRNFELILRNADVLNKHLSLNRLQRAIGVLYLPESERMSHYFFAKLPEQFDAIIHIDCTSALRPLEEHPVWQEKEFETYPSGL